MRQSDTVNSTDIAQQGVINSPERFPKEKLTISWIAIIRDLPDETVAGHLTAIVQINGTVSDPLTQRFSSLKCVQ